MTTPPVTFHWRNSELHVIPARHFCHVFAESVNRICSDPATKPEAIAVELGPETAAAALSWLTDLGIGTPGERLFPVMLALLKPNRMIRSSFKQKAFRLQSETNKDIRELSPETLRRELGFSEQSALFLSPVDSIIEGLRCGLELGVPVHGVDLEESGQGLYTAALIEDPPAVGNDMDMYLARTLPIAEMYRDDEIDARREIVMAARLKGLMARHKRVVFTCGMAHWLRLRTLLSDNSIVPTVLDGKPDSAAGDFQRVVVHPQIAARYMDLFPAVVREYEKRRRPAFHVPNCLMIPRLIDTRALYRKNLSRAYRAYFSRKGQSLPSFDYSPDSFGSFEDYLGNLCRLRHRRVPDLFAVIHAAQDMIGGELAKAMAVAFMKFPWTAPKEHPGCALLSPSSDSGKQTGSAMLVKEGVSTGKNFSFHTLPADCESSATARLPFEWRAPDRSTSTLYGHAWPPWNCLISAMSFSALQRGSRKKRKKKPVEFAGSLMDGIDVKPTIRAFSRGNEQIYVRDTLYETQSAPVSPLDGFPVVWILSPGEHPNASWNTLHEPSSYMQPYIRDKESFRRVHESRGSNMVVVFAYGDSDYRGLGLPRGQGIKVERLYGILLFQPILWSNKQFARWAELTHYRRNPFCRDTYLDHCGGSDLQKFYAREHDLKLGENDWVTTLILLGLPFTRDVLTVVVPDGYRIDGCVYKKAKSYGVEVAATSARLFPPEDVARLSICHLAPAIGTDPCVFSREIERAIGEPQTAYRHLVPPVLANFGGGE